MKQKKKYVLILLGIVIIFTFITCFKPQINAFKNLYEYSFGTGMENTVYCFFKSYVNNDLNDIKKYGKVIFECPQSQIDDVDVAFLNMIKETSILLFQDNELEVNKMIANSVYDQFFWIYVTSYFFVDNNVVVPNTKDIFGVFDIGLPRLKSEVPFSKYQDISYGSSLFKEDFPQKVLTQICDTLAFYTLSRDNCNFDDIYNALMTEYGKLENSDLSSFYALIYSLGFYDNNMFVPENFIDGKVKYLGKEKEIIVLVNELMKIEELTCQKLIEEFNSAPNEVFDENHIIRTYEDANYIVAFYGEPVNAISVTNKKNHKVIHTTMRSIDEIKH